MGTNICFGAVSPFALMPSTLVVDGRGRMSTGVGAHQEKTGYAAGLTAAAQASNAQTTDLRGIPPRGSAPV